MLPQIATRTPGEGVCARVHTRPSSHGAGCAHDIWAGAAVQQRRHLLLKGPAAWAEKARGIAADLRGHDFEEPGLAGGAAGIALLHHALGDVEERDRLLALAVRRLTEARWGLSLFTGLSGVAWALAFLGRDANLVDQIDAALPRRLEQTDPSDEFDLVYGLAGVGVYARFRRHDRLLRLVQERLAAAAVREDGHAWWFSPRGSLPDWQLEQAPDGYVNLGLAHGAPGVLPVLEGSLRAEALAFVLEAAEADPMVAWVTPDGGARPGRTAWCYGEPGVACALETIGEHDAARRLVERAAARPVEETRVADAGICHGAGGLALIFHCLGAGAAGWADRAASMPVPEAPGVLEGAAGVALALLTAAGETDAAWAGWLCVPAPS